MTKLSVLCALVVLLAVSSPVPASAWGAVQGLATGSFTIEPLQLAGALTPTKKKPTKHRKRVKSPEVRRSKTPKTDNIPELDPSALGAAAVLLLGGTLVATGRRRREQPR